MSDTTQRRVIKKHSIIFKSKDGVNAFKDLISWMERELWEVAIDEVIPKQENEHFTILVSYHVRSKE